MDDLKTNTHDNVDNLGGLSGASPSPSLMGLKRGRGRPLSPYVLTGVLSGRLVDELRELSREQWTDVVGLAPDGAVKYDHRVKSFMIGYSNKVKKEAFRHAVASDVLAQPDIFGVVFHPSTFDLLAASRDSLLYGMTYNTFKVLVLCYIVTAREGGDKYLSVVDIAKSDLIPVQTCREQFKRLQAAGLVGKAKFLDVHGCRGNLAKRATHYFTITSKGKETIRDFYKAYVQKLRDFQELFGKLESSFKFK